MSQQLINHSPDLKRLRDDGYEIVVRLDGYLLVSHIPYVNSNKEIKFGVLVSQLSLANDVTIKPETHVVYFIGEYPCNKDGSIMTKIVIEAAQKEIAKDLTINFTFSSKPVGGSYNDYYEKMTTYANILSNQAEAINSEVTAKTFPLIETEEGESVFKYIDTASSRAGISLIASKLEIEKIGIVGLGGTGSYVLDLVAKTLVKEIHLFDGDKFSQHNAFRSPGAISGKELKDKPLKVDYYKNQYSKMHWNIIAHNCYVDASNVDQLREMNFVFLCIDSGSVKKLIIETLEESDISFIDVGMGVYQVNESLQGILRITTSTVNKREHIRDNHRISFSDASDKNDYSQNIQIADLNALNAALAVIKWKKLFGFYSELDNGCFSIYYTIDGNKLINEDKL